MEKYLIRALEDDIGVLQLINVIRISLGKEMLHTGADGEDHHLSKKKQLRLQAELEIETEPEENEELEIDEIVASFINKE